MKILLLASVMMAVAMVTSLSAQTWSCVAPGPLGTSVSCAPGSANCTCTQVAAPPVTVAPICPAGAYWNGYTCEVYVPPVVVEPHPIVRH